MFEKRFFLSVFIFSIIYPDIINAISLPVHSFGVANFHPESDLKFISNPFLKGNILDGSSPTNFTDKEIGFLYKSIIPFYMEEWIVQQNSSDDILQQQDNICQSPSDISAQCCYQVSKWLEELNKARNEPDGIFTAETWALHMIDAWGKIPEGILSGHTSSFGDWDECKNLQGEINVNGNNKQNVKGHYCTSYLIPRLPGPTTKKASNVEELLNLMMSPSGGLLVPSIASCLPSICSDLDAAIIMTSVFSPISSIIENPIVVCDVKGPSDTSYDTADVAMIALLSLLGVILLIATIIDVVLTCMKQNDKDNRGIALRSLLAFSVYTNVIKWSNTESGNGTFGCLHGLRFLSTAWVILGHTWLVYSMQPTVWNLVDVKQVFNGHWSLYVILNATLSVDTFFVLSGFLAVYAMLKELNKSKGKLNVPLLYLHRYLRLTPTYALIIGFTATLLFYLSDGPYWPDFADAEGNSCRNNWWHNLLYINNLIEYDASTGDALCIGESWYISNDMQFFLLSPLYAYLLWKWEKFGLGFLTLSCIASIAAPAIITHQYNIAPTFMPHINDPDMIKTYYKPWNRIGPYLGGIWLAYILYKSSQKSIKIPKIFVVIGWTLSTAVALTLIFGIIPYYRLETDARIGSAFYAGFQRFSWGLVMVWIVFSCIKGYGGWVNSFLSWKAFIPLGRLTFCVYVTSLRVQFFLQLRHRQPIIYDELSAVTVYFSHILMAFLIGFIVSMAAEAPFIQLEKILIQETISRSKTSETGNETEKNNEETMKDYAIAAIPRINTVHTNI